MQDTGFKLPTTTPTPGTQNQWSNATNGYAEDGVFATSGTGGVSQSYGTFGFSIPAGATINGIEVLVKAKNNGGGFGLDIALYNSTPSGQRAQALTTTNTQYDLGSSSDLWTETSHSWVATDFSDANFAPIVLSTAGGSNNVSLDGIQIKVYYTPLATTTSTSSTSSSTSSTSVSSTSSSISTSSTSTSTSLTTMSTSSTSSSTSISVSSSTSTSTTTLPRQIDIPVSIIEEQALTTPPFINDSTLFDDPVALFDDPIALFGGPVTIIKGIQSKVENRPPNAKIDIYH